MKLIYYKDEIINLSKVDVIYFESHKEENGEEVIKLNFHHLVANIITKTPVKFLEDFKAYFLNDLYDGDLVDIKEIEDKINEDREHDQIDS